MYDEYGFAALLDYMAHQMMVMVMYAAVCSDDSLKEDKRFDKAVELLKKKKTVSETFQAKLMAMAKQSNSGATVPGAVQ